MIPPMSPEPWALGPMGWDVGFRGQGQEWQIDSADDGLDPAGRCGSQFRCYCDGEIGEMKEISGKMIVLDHSNPQEDDSTFRISISRLCRSQLIQWICRIFLCTAEAHGRAMILQFHQKWHCHILNIDTRLPQLPGGCLIVADEFPAGMICRHRLQKFEAY